MTIRFIRDQSDTLDLKVNNRT